MRSELIIRISYDLYETYYGGNQICIVKDNDGYYVLDTNSGFSSQVYRLKSDALKKFRSHLKQHYTTTKSN
jgi:hypothetical protein